MPRGAAAEVLQIADVALDHVVVLVPQRQLPAAVARRLAGSEHAGPRASWSVAITPVATLPRATITAPVSVETR